MQRPRLAQTATGGKRIARRPSRREDGEGHIMCACAWGVAGLVILNSYARDRLSGCCLALCPEMTKTATSLDVRVRSWMGPLSVIGDVLESMLEPSGRRG